MTKDNYLTVSEVATFLGCLKEDVKKLVDDGYLTPYKARESDVRYVLSMIEVNKDIRKLNQALGK